MNKHRRLAAGLLAAAVWWGLLGGLWMLLVDTVSIAEIVCAALAALAGTLATRLMLRGGLAPMRPAGSMLAAAARQMARVPSDIWLLAVALSRALAGHQTSGRFHELVLEIPIDATGNGRRAMIELVGSLAPNTIVLGVDERRVIIHQLLARQDERKSIAEIGS